MKKAMFVIILAAAFLASAFSLYQYFSSSEISNTILPPELAIDPKPTDMRVRVNLYFPYENKLRVEERIVTVSQEKLEVAISQELQTGPKNLAYTDLFKNDVQILDVRISNNVCYVNLTESFLDQNYIANEKSELYVWSIVNSFAQIDNVYRVQILIEGRRRDVQVGDANLYQLLTSNNTFVYEDRRYPSNSVIEFIDAIIDRRFDRAYGYLTQASQEAYSFEAFQEAAQIHFDALRGYRRTIYFTQGFSQSWIVYVKYVSADRTDPEIVTTRFELWEVVEVDGDWKIIFDK